MDNPRMADDPRAEQVRELHSSYEERRLRVLVGAGTSVGAGFSHWEGLTLGLLRRFLRVARKSQPEALLSTMVPQLYEALGRDGCADFIRAACEKEKDFFELFTPDLYQRRALEDLPVT